MEEQKQRIKRYLNKKINPKVIAIELKVPLELVKECKQEIILETQKQQQLRTAIKSPNAPTSYLKMQVLREKYKRAYNPDKEKAQSIPNKTSQDKQLSKDELKEAEMLIATIENKAAQLGNASRQEARKIAFSALEDVKILMSLQPLPLELAERFKKTMAKIEIFKTSKEDKLPTVVNNAKRIAAERLVQAINILQQKTDDIEELRRISLMLTPDIERQSRVLVGTVKGEIQRKITSLQQKKAIDKIKNIPPNIAEIVVNLANGDIDIQAARLIIEKEAQLRVASRPQSRFAVTEEQEKRQIAIQIRNAISENPDKYQFKDPEAAIGQLQALCGTDEGQTIRAIVLNLIGRKHFERAKRICRKFSTNEQTGALAVYIRRLFEEIKNAEVADMILEGINMNGTPEEQAAYYNAIEVTLKKEDVNLSAVSLGKNCDGTKNITLADIWLPEPKKGKNR